MADQELNDKKEPFSSTSEKDLEMSSELKANKYKYLRLIIIISILILIIIFIFILIFVTQKKENNDNSNNNPIPKEEDSDKIPIIIDVDESGDDMISYLVANISKKYNILGITTFNPNYCVDEVADVWLRFLEYMNFDAKVYKGAEKPISRQTNKTSIDFNYLIDFPETNKTVETKNAVDFMVETIKNSKQKITLFLIAPLTNFALAYERDHSIINNIKEIIIMGGTKSRGNISFNKKAEYNIYTDAEAANIVFNCGIKIKVMGNDVTHKVEFTDEIYQKYKDMNTKSSFFIYNVMNGTYLSWGDKYLDDPVTFLYHINNDLITLKDYYFLVNTTNPDVNDTEYGTIYFIEQNDTLKANVEYSENINLDLYWKTFDSIIKNY